MSQTNAEEIKKNLRARYYFVRLRRPKHWGWLSSDEAKLLQSLKELNIPIQDFYISVPEYRDYFDQAGYTSRYPGYYSWNIAEKSLEHFIAQKILELNPGDVYIDIASEGSPVPEIYQRLYGSTTYAQDLTYEPGVHGNRIGSDAAAIPLPDGSVTKIALHCSFEHFEGNSDSGFIREVARLLQVGGKLVILPLYLSSYYSILTDPFVSMDDKIDFDPGAVIAAVKGWGNRHGRFYDARHFASRVLSASKELSFKLMILRNPKEVDKSIYAQFVLVGTRIDAPPGTSASDGVF